MLSRFGIPKQLVIALGIMVTWAAYRLLQSITSFIEGNTWPVLALLSSVSTLCIVWRLFHQDKRAWWAAVLVIGLKLVFAAPAFSAMVYYSLQVPSPMSSLANNLGAYRVLSESWVMLLTIAFCLLLSPSTRAAFREPKLAAEEAV